MNIRCHTLGIAVTKEEREQVEALAKGRGVSVSELLYPAVRVIVATGTVPGETTEAPELEETASGNATELSETAKLAQQFPWMRGH